MNTLVTSSFLGWREIAFLSSQGFTMTTDEDDSEQRFTSSSEVEEIYDGWEPSKDGSSLTNWSDLTDKNSPHYGRRYITAYKYTNNGYENVLVFSSSPHNSGQLFSLIGVGSFREWEHNINDPAFGLAHWMSYNNIYLG